MSHSEEIAGPFDTVAEGEFSRRERYVRLFKEWVYTPFVIMWNDWRGKIGLSLLGMYLLMGTVGVWLLEEPEIGQGERWVNVFQDPTMPLGTDNSGYSLFSQIVHSTPEILMMVTAGAVFATGLATLVGLSAGYKGGLYERVVMTFTDIALTLPPLPLVIVIAAVVGPRNPFVLGIILAINAWAGLGRTIHSQTLVLRNEAYVEASRLMDIRLRTIMIKELLPNLMPYIAVNFMITARNVIFFAVGLFYLGVLPRSGANWGTMLDQAFRQGNIWDPGSVYWFLVPMTTLLLFSLALILLSQSMDAIFNPRIRARHTSDAQRPPGEVVEDEPEASAHLAGA